MKIIDAFWEEQNLGLKTCEIVFEENENITSDKLLNPESKYQYIVVKIPSGDINTVHELERCGYRFIENQFVVTIDPRDIDNMKKSFIDHFQNVSIEKLTTAEELAIILSNISDGLFVYDRISVDPFFRKEQSLRRLQNWIKDLYNRDNVEIFFLTSKGERIGFLLVENIKNVKLLITFAGIFNSYKNSGLAFFLVYFTMQLALKKKITKVEAVFSSNNKNMFNIISRTIRFRVKNNYMVLRKIV